MYDLLDINDLIINLIKNNDNIAYFPLKLGYLCKVIY